MVAIFLIIFASLECIPDVNRCKTSIWSSNVLGKVHKFGFLDLEFFFKKCKTAQKRLNSVWGTQTQYVYSLGKKGSSSKHIIYPKCTFQPKYAQKWLKFCQKIFNWHPCLGMASFSCRRWRKIFDMAMGLKKKKKKKKKKTPPHFFSLLVLLLHMRLKNDTSSPVDPGPSMYKAPPSWRMSSIDINKKFFSGHIG